MSIIDRAQLTAAAAPVDQRSRRGPLLWIGSIIVVVVVVGVIVAVRANSSNPSSEPSSSPPSSSTSSSSSHSVATLKAVLDKVPLPTGATLRDEQVEPQKGDANAFVQRQYDLPPSAESSEQVREALTRSGSRLVDPGTGQTSLVSAGDWSTLVTPTSGDLWILPPGTKGGGVNVSWKDSRLFISVKGGDAELR